MNFCCILIGILYKLVQLISIIKKYCLYFSQFTFLKLLKFGFLYFYEWPNFHWASEL